MKEEDRFSENIRLLCSFINDLLDRLELAGYPSRSRGNYQLSDELLQKFTGEELIRFFIEGSLPYWNDIYDRSNGFLMNKADDLFKGIPYYRGPFKELLEAATKDGIPLISEGDIDSIWEYFHSQIKVSLRYIHRKRQPYSSITGQGVLHGYNNGDFMREVDLPREARRWGLALDFGI